MKFQIRFYSEDGERTLMQAENDAAMPIPSVGETVALTATPGNRDSNAFSVVEREFHFAFNACVVNLRCRERRT